MVDLSTWISKLGKTTRSNEIDTSIKAAEALRRISARPAQAVFRTPNGARLTAQTVRIESDNTATPGESTAGSAPVRKVIVYGIKNHPTLPDTNMREGYVFVYEGDEYKCVDVISTRGEIQGIWEATG
jgi:hypothetical protein